jgi:hypothetical protein
VRRPDQCRIEELMSDAAVAVSSRRRAALSRRLRHTSQTDSSTAMADAKKGTFAVKVGLAQMLKGGVIMDVVNAVRPAFASLR